jgi:hypothetical protein
VIVIAALLLFAAGFALLYEKREPGLVRVEKRTTIRPWVVLVLAGLGLYCVYSSGCLSDSGGHSDQGHSKEVKPVGNNPTVDWPSSRDKQ